MKIAVLGYVGSGKNIFIGLHIPKEKHQYFRTNAAQSITEKAVFSHLNP